ncbi:MAG: Tfp pilus assembly protein FimT/FimU [Kiritimatiellia bacterium]
MNMGRTKDGFTLMELLVVVAIMAVIMGITIPAFTTMGKGSGMRGAISQLRSTISLSRQWAVTHRAKTYVLFPYVTGSTDLNTKDYVEKACKAYAVFAVTNVQGIVGDDLSAAGEFITDWKFLPSDIVLDDDADLTNNVFRAATPLTAPLSGKKVEMYAIIFKPDGTPNDVTGYQVFLREGYLNVFTNDLANPDYGFTPNGIVMGVEVSGYGGIKVNDWNGIL